MVLHFYFHSNLGQHIRSKMLKSFFKCLKKVGPIPILGKKILIFKNFSCQFR
jgi:hypothetical protein